MKKFFQNICLAGVLVSSASLYPLSVKTPETLATWLQDFTYEEDDKDKWKKPKETVKDKSGDCEDSALLVHHVLKDLKYEVKVLAIYFSDRDSGHAITIVEIDDKYTMFSNFEYFSEPYDNLRTLITDYYPKWSKIYYIFPKKVKKGILIGTR